MGTLINVNPRVPLHACSGNCKMGDGKGMYWSNYIYGG